MLNIGKMKIVQIVLKKIAKIFAILISFDLFCAK